jgi:hypothetical protein
MMARHGGQWHEDDQEDFHVLYEDNCRFFDHQSLQIDAPLPPRA